MTTPIKEPNQAARVEAKNNPGGWVYEIDKKYGTHNAVPPEAIVGAWKVDENGEIVGEFVSNPNYKGGGSQCADKNRG